MSWWILGFFGWVSDDPHQGSIGNLEPFFALCFVTILGPILDPAGIPKSTQNATFDEKWCHRNRCFIEFHYLQLFMSFLTFLWFFWFIFDEKSMFFPLLFSNVFSPFLKPAKAKFYAQAQCFEQFLLFVFFFKKCKNLREKSMKKVKTEKWPKLTTRGVPE